MHLILVRRVLRRLGLLLLGLIGLGNLVCGAAPSGQTLPRLVLLLEQQWGGALARTFAEAAPMLLQALALPGCAWQVDGPLTQRIVGAGLGQLWNVIRAWPLRVSAHLIALSLWLGLLALLAVLLGRTGSRPPGQPAASWRIGEPGNRAAEADWGTLILPALALATLVWCLLPLASVVQAPGWGLAWLLACRWGFASADRMPSGARK
jgi:hypothetical protein